MVKSNVIWKNLFLGIFVLNIFLLAFPFNPEQLETSNNFFTSWLRTIGLEPQQPDTYHPVPLLTSGSPYSIPRNQSSYIPTNLKLSDYFVPGWADTRWQYRKNITIDHLKVSGDLINYPLYIELFDEDLQDDAQASGNDILFTNVSGHILDHEIEIYQRVYNSTHAHLIAWVRANLSSSQDTILSMYYGNPTAVDQSNPSDVWDENYEFVLHMNQNPSSSKIFDSTINAFDFNVEVSSSMTPNDLVDGQTGLSLAFDGVDDYIYLPISEGFNGPTDKMTFEFWIMFPNGGPGSREILAGPATSAADPYVAFYDNLEFHVETTEGVVCDSTQNSFSAGIWYHIVGLWDGTGAGLHEVYINGILDGEDTTPLTGTHVAWNTLSIGAEDDDADGPGGSTTDREIHATVSEFRLSNSIRSSEWIATEYKNQNNPNTFYSTSAKENYIPPTSYWSFPSFSYRKEIIIDATKVSGDLTNFPLAIDLFDTDLHDPSKVQADGDDIIFTDSNGNRLDHEIEKFNQNSNSTHAHLVAWVKIPSLSSTFDTHIFMYFGNRHLSSQANAIAVWNSNFKGVWHLNQDPAGTAPQIIDSTSNNNDGTTSNLPSNFLTTGKLDGALNFDSAEMNYINMGDQASLNMGSGDFSLELWFRYNSADSNAGPLAGKGAYSGGGKRYFIAISSTSGEIKAEIDDDITKCEIKSPSTYGDDSWHHAVMVRDGNWLRFYIDGAEITGSPLDITGVGSLDNAGMPFTVNTLSSDYLTPTFTDDATVYMDEIRVSNIAQSANWIITAYTNQFDSDTFYSVNSLESNENTFPYLRFKKDLTINKAVVSGSSDLYDFPFLIDIYDKDLHLAEKVQADGDDIAFTDANGMRINHEIEDFNQNYNTTHAHLIAWVEIPVLSQSTDTIIYLWYGNSAVSSLANPDRLWQQYGGIWHLNDDFLDSTSNNNDGVNYQSSDVSAKIADAQDFDGSNDYINVGSGSSIDYLFNTGATISAWIYPEGWGGGLYGRILDKSAQTDGTDGWVMCIDGVDHAVDNHLLFYRDFSTSRGLWYTPENSISLSQWQYVVVTYDDSSSLNVPTIYINGIQQSLTPEPSPSGAAETDPALSLYIGNSLGGTRGFNGVIDEVRLSTEIRSADWILTEYYNQLNPQNFISTGTESQRLWADSSFSYSKDIIINYAQVTQDLTNFPLLIDITNTGLKSGTVQSNGADILFTDPLGKKLNHEIESFTQTSSNGHLIAWILVPHLYSTDYTAISMYYGNNKVSIQQNPEKVWDPNYRGIWHLKETSGGSYAIVDSTLNNNDGTDYANPSLGQTGKIGNAIDFAGYSSDQEIVIDADESLNPTFITVSAWIKPRGQISGGETGMVVSDYDWTSASTKVWFIFLHPNNRIYATVHWDNDIDNTTVMSDPISLNEWHYITFTVNSTYVQLFVDGSYAGAFSSAAITGGINQWLNPIEIGSEEQMSSTEHEFNGTIDEVRISSNSHSPEWIKTEFTNQYDPVSFSSTTTEFSLDVNPPVVNNFGAEDLGTGIGKFWADVTDSVSSVSSVEITINETDHSMSYNGTYWIYQTSVDYGATYEYQITNASDERANYITSPSIQKYQTFDKDIVSPDVIDWEYYPELGLYGTFKANVSDSWGEIDTVLVNVTKSNGVPRNDLWAIMRSTASGYMNDTIVMDSGPIYYEIIVNDTAGNTFTSNEHQGFVPIVNHPPEVSDITLSRDQSSILLPVYSNSTLYLNYTFYDQDNDDEGGTEIRWYKNGVLQSLYNNQKSVPASALFKGDAWNVTVKPKDGQVFGTLGASATVIIQNTPPKVTTVSISPSTPLTTQQLTVTNTTTDDDGDSLTYEVKWFNPSENTSYAGLVVIPSDQTKKGETWWCEVRAWDGSNYSSWKLSNSVTIQNSAPSASSLAITPSSALTTDELHATYVFTDADNDLESNSYIRWFKNGVEQPAYENLTTIPAAATLKGQNWYFTVQPCDGVAYGTQKQSAVKTIENTPPTANNLQITPISATTGDSLTAAYDYADADNDGQSGTKILWYKDGVLQGTLNDSQTVSSSYTAKGQSWHFKVQPSDGTDFGIWVSCPVNLTIQNTAPSASTLQITPSDAKTSNTLTANYIYTDADGDPQSGSEIIWYQNGLLMGGLNGSITVSSSYTTKGDSWHFKVRPRDGIDFGVWVSCPINVTIANTAPSVSNLEITPTSPITTDILSINYNFIDADSDSETNSRIRWFKNGIEQSAYENDTSIPAAATKKGENWYFKLTPFDGTDYGVEQQSDVVMIENTPPSATNLYITPSDAKTTDILTANYDYADLDNDIQSGTQILWYKDGVLQGALNDSKTVSSSYTTKGEIWHFKVQPSDGTDFGSWVSCPVNITIQNTAPSASSLQITPSDAKTSNTLTANYVYADADGDPQSGSEIIWYKNGTLMGALNDSTTVDFSYTTKGDIWHFKVRPSDSFDLGLWYSCPINLTIGNTPPSAEDIQLNGRNTSAQISENDDLVVSYDYYDLDGDAEATSSLEILWYKNNVLVPALTNCLLVGSTNTSSGEIWYYKIRVHDGTDYSTQEISPSATIEVTPNNPPQILYLNITPSMPLTSDSLYINYTFVDSDNDSEDGTIYRWYRNGILVPDYVLQTLPAIATAKGDVWHVKVRPRDGKDFGNWVSVPINVTIGNTAPSASNLAILPSNPVTSTDLTLSYTFQDLDSSDTESGSEIRWFKDGVLQGALNDSPSVASSYTAKDQSWHMKVRPSDGTDFGEWVSCPVNITIQNTAPSASTLSITPLNAKTQDNLTATYIFTDIDSDDEGESYIRWYRDGVEQTSYENQTTIPNTVTTKGQIWYFTIQPSDGEDLGIERTSPGLTIRNTAPSLSNLEIAPSTVTTLDPLTVIYTYSDVDTDPQSGTSILWYKDDILQGSLNNSLTVATGYTAKGQTWHVKVRPKDGTDFGVWYSCLINITIGNALPNVSNLQISPSDAKTTQDLVALYTFSDVDFDTETNSAIIWFINGIEQPLWENQTLIPASNTIKGDIWHFKVCPSDGFDYGTMMSCPVNVTIANSDPTASSLQITPSGAMTEDDLQAIYTYFDADGDTEGLSLLRWYKNGIEQSAYENDTSISAVTTTKGDNWYFTIRPFDGTGLGVLKTSGTITISNTPPSANNLQFTPINPTSDDNLGFSYTFTDPDPDILINLEIRWYCNDILQSTYNDINIIDKSVLIKGDQWNLSIRVSDGTDYSEWSNTTVIILNSAPSVSGFPYFDIPSGQLYTSNNLIAMWDEYDADGDTIVDQYVRWFKYNGTIWYEMFEIENYTEVPSSFTTKHDQWRFRVQIFDGVEWSDWSSDALQTIVNSEPIIENITLTGGISTINNIILSYDFYDADNDLDVSKIEWKIVHSYSGSVETIESNKTLLSTTFYAGDLIWVVITPDDNEDTGQPVDSSTLSGSQVMKLIGNTAPQINTSLGYPLILSDHPNGSSIYNTETAIFIDYAYLVFDIDSEIPDSNYDIAKEQNYDVEHMIVYRIIGAQYRWYKFNVGSGTWELQPELTKSFVDSYYLHRDEQWMGSVRPRDKYGYYGAWVNSTSIEIGNSLPEIRGFSWILPTPTTEDDLAFSFVYYDYDNDPLELSQTLILWLKDGEVILGTENTTILPSTYFQKNNIITVILRPFDGSDWALTNYTSDPVTIVNSPPSLAMYNLAPTTISNLEILALNWLFFDVDGDTEAFSQVYILWYRNGALQTAYTNQSFISLEETANGDLWRVDLRVSDGFSYSPVYSVDIFTKKLTIEYCFDLTGQVDPNIRVDEFYVEDENLSINYYFNTIGDVSNVSIRWFTDQGTSTWLEAVEFENQSVIPSEATLPGQKWYCSIIPFDGTYTWAHLNSSIISIESRPSLSTLASEIITIEEDVEGHYTFVITVNDTYHSIYAVEYSFNDTIGGTKYAEEVQGTNTWTLDYQLTPIQFQNLLSHLILADIKIITQVDYDQTFEIYQTFTFNFTITDAVAPRVKGVDFIYNATSITFYAELQEYGSAISEVSLYYYFEEVSAAAPAGLGASFSQSEYSVFMSLLNSSALSSLYSVTIPFDGNGTDWKVIYRIATLDSAGNSNPTAWDVQRDDPDSIERNIIKYLPPGLPEWILLVAGAMVVLIFIGAVVYVKFIRKPEIVGLDKELVLNKISDVTETEVRNTMELHTIGIVVSFFDQRHGPIPIIVLPEILKDNFTKLVELSDRSFSSCGFADNFSVEIPSSYDFVLSQGIRISSLSYGYALERPNSRGGQENITLNILVHQDLFPLVESFKDEIRTEVHKIHLHMDKKEEEMDEINKMIKNLREFISYIILSYENIYQTTELIKEEK